MTLSVLLRDLAVSGNVRPQNSVMLMLSGMLAKVSRKPWQT